MPVQVIDQQQVNYSTHTVTLNRIAPPAFPTPTPTPTPTSKTGTNTNAAKRRSQSRGVSRSAQSKDASNDVSKAFQVVFLSATVYDHQFTELRFYGGSNPELSVYVNIDFNYFAGVEQIETADTVYMIFFGLGNDTAASLT